jgi:hypothetical protein
MYKVADVRKAIEYHKARQLRTDFVLEHYEAIACDASHPAIRFGMLKNIAILREQNTLARAKNRREIAMLEHLLAEDEAANFWKGEDRLLDI